MKKYILSTLLLGSTSLISCSEKYDGSHVIESLDAGKNSEASERKIWPPVSDDDAAAKITENFLVVLDDSGSMAGSKMRQAKEALKKLAETLPAEHNLGLMLLNGHGVVPLATNNRGDFNILVNSSNARGSTPLTASTARAYNEITEQASRQQGYGSYHVIIVTDGESSDGSPMSIVKKVVNNTAVQFHVIGFHVSSHGMNDPLYVDYRTATNSSELVKAFEEVAAETNEFSDPKEFSN